MSLHNTPSLTQKTLRFFQQPATGLGFFFLWINLTYSHAFYQVNSYKLALVWVGLCGLVLTLFLKKKETQIEVDPLWLAAPLLLILTRQPGLLHSQMAFNYNFAYELASLILAFLWFFLLLIQLDDQAKIRVFFGWVAVVAILSGVWSLVEFILTPGAYPQASYGHRNYMSGALIQGLPVLIAIARPWEAFGNWNQLPFLRKLCGYGLVFGLIALFLAQTRAAIFALGLALWLMTWIRLRQFNRQGLKKFLLGSGVLFLLALLTLGLFLLFGPTHTSSRFLELFSARAWIGRWIPWQAAWSSFSASPLWGWGLGSSYSLFFTYVTPYAALLHQESSYNHAHSELLELLQEGGLLVFAAYLFLWAQLFFAAKKALLAQENEARWLALGIAGGLFAYLVHSLVSVSPRMVVSFIPYWAWMAFLFRLNQPRINKGVIPSLPAKLGLSLGILILAGSLLLPWLKDQYRFVQAQEKIFSPQRAKGYYQLSQLLKQSRDIYAWDLAAHEQIRLNLGTELGKSTLVIESIIPHYRENDFHKAVALVLQQKFSAAYDAIRLALKYRHHHLPSLRLAINLAIEQNQEKDFQLYLSNLTQKIAFDARLAKSYTPTGVQVYILASSNDFLIQDQKEALILELPYNFIHELFEAARAYRRLPPGFAQNQQEKFKRNFSGLIARHRYFQPPWKGKPPQDLRPVYEKINQYFQLQTAMARMAQKRGPQPDAKLEAHLQKTEREAGQIATELRPIMDWDAFAQRQKFIAEWMNELARLLFPLA